MLKLNISISLYLYVRVYSNHSSCWVMTSCKNIGEEVGIVMNGSTECCPLLISCSDWQFILFEPNQIFSTEHHRISAVDVWDHLFLTNNHMSWCDTQRLEQTSVRCFVLWVGGLCCSGPIWSAPSYMVPVVGAALRLSCRTACLSCIACKKLTNISATQTEAEWIFFTLNTWGASVSRLVSCEHTADRCKSAGGVEGSLAIWSSVEFFVIKKMRVLYKMKTFILDTLSSCVLCLRVSGCSRDMKSLSRCAVFKQDSLYLWRHMQVYYVASAPNFASTAFILHTLHTTFIQSTK